MRSYLYLSTAVAGVMMTAGAGVSFAQCVTTQNCAELGYTETSCPDGTGLKCPFGDTFACTGGSSEITPEQCTQLGFTHTCTGTNETGGGELCNNKYAFCSCADGYEWSNGSCNKINSPVACSIGTLYYSDGTCYNHKADYKTLLGVVIKEKTTSANGWIMTVKPVQLLVMFKLVVLILQLLPITVIAQLIQQLGRPRTIIRVVLQAERVGAYLQVAY